jgi:class 3 adenylate cyclase
MALFPESPDNALDAALDIQRELSVYNQHRASVGYSSVDVGISLHTGTLMLGIIGGEE